MVEFLPPGPDGGRRFRRRTPGDRPAPLRSIPRAAIARIRPRPLRHLHRRRAEGAPPPRREAKPDRCTKLRRGVVLYRLPVIPRCGRVNRQAYHVWGMEDAGILFSQRTGGGRAAALGTTRERACLPAGSDDREHARGDGAWGSGAAGWAEPVSGLRMA